MFSALSAGAQIFGTSARQASSGSLKLLAYYQGVDDGESWSEGSQNSDATLSSLSAGTYTLRVEGTLDNVTQPLPVSVKVEQNVTRGVNFICALLVLFIMPVLGLIWKITFESRRWKDSMFGSSTSGSDDSGGYDE